MEAPIVDVISLAVLRRERTAAAAECARLTARITDVVAIRDRLASRVECLDTLLGLLDHYQRDTQPEPVPY